ncbi:hypothetical protein [Merismopedia glauca]|uniref:Uncharacterized protein n=1 Tax=Merismopedia glauca CCAP 1448/3 TaxID=1296344 RepID=A0A2T1BYG7_9CYAN|nr:hypothetical protein [Merismopedia glauca]PSB01070.1 hypothetical protein C7B64_20190 [Merismopedia glauca CCAP 1448/3]
MNLSPALQQAIKEISSSQGISPEQFIVQTLTEKIGKLKQSNQTSVSQTGLKERDGILVFETESLNGIDFNELIAQSRQERDLEQMGL